MTSDAENIVGLYQRHASAWAGERGDRLFEASWLDRFRRLVPVCGSVLDIGCGSGRPIARTLLEEGYDVTGVDSSPEMIAMCQRSFPDQTWQLADMRTLALGRRFDGVIAWDSFFHLCPEDQRAMFSRFRAHAAAGAALMFTSGPRFGVALGTLCGETLYHASLDADEYRALLAANGFEVVGHVVEDPLCGGRTVWLAKALA